MCQNSCRMGQAEKAEEKAGEYRFFHFYSVCLLGEKALIPLTPHPRGDFQLYGDIVFRPDTAQGLKRYGFLFRISLAFSLMRYPFIIEERIW